MSKPSNPELAKRIVAIALEELSSKPPSKVNMRTIAERAGVSATAIYYYFSSKDVLFERIKFDAMDELEARIESAIKPADNPKEKLTALVRTYAQWCLERPHVARLLMEELPPKEALTEESMKRYYAAFLTASDLLAEAVASGMLVKRDIPLDVSVVQAAIWGIVAQFRSKRVHPRYWDSIDPLIDRFIDLYFNSQGATL